MRPGSDSALPIPPLKLPSEPQEVLGAAVTAIVAATVVSFIFYKMASRKQAPSESSPIDFGNQSVVIDAKTAHRASWLAKPPDYVKWDCSHPDLCTVFDALLLGKTASNNGPCLGSRTGPNREYEWLSYEEVIQRVQWIGCGLLAKGYAAKNDTYVGIYASNRIEWTLADYGAQAFSMCPVALYDTLGNDAVKYVLNQCELHVVFCDTAVKLENLLNLKPVVPSLELIVMVEEISDTFQARATELGVELILFQDLMELGKQNLKDFTPPKSSDIYSICYTSGTSGEPKGAMLTHEGFVYMVLSIMKSFHHKIGINQDDVHLSYLPLAHNIDRATHVLMFICGASIGYFSRDITLLSDDLATLKPTIFLGVPRILNRIYDAVHKEVKSSKIKSTIFNWAMASKMKDINKGIYKRDSLWDKILFRKIQNKLGGRVRVTIYGSAPLSEDVLTFLRCSLGCYVMEGYGQTEAGAGLTFSLPDDPSTEGCGPPLPGFQIKLVDVPDLGFFVKDNYGEVCAKGDSILKGYFKLPDKTAEALDEDGWLHTGDIGTWLPNGCLKIVDRKKHIFKLSQGEYIAPERIEIIYTGSPLVAQCFVEGNSLKSNIMAVIVPDAEYLNKWAPNNGYSPDIHSFCQDEKAKSVIIQELHELGKEAGLKGFEQVKDIILEPEMFSIDNGTLTPTLKNKRGVLRNKYKGEIEKLYGKHEL